MAESQTREIHASVRQEREGRWQGTVADLPVRVSAGTREACLRGLWAAVRARLADRGVTSFTLAAEIVPKLVGVAEAAELVGWDKRHVITYLNRGSFPEPLESLAGGRIWALDDVLAFRESLEARRAARKAKAGHPDG